MALKLPIFHFQVLSMSWLVIKALVYKHKYLTKDRFDNIYITKTFYNLDDKRREKGIESLTPFTWQENEKYIHLDTYHLSKGEKQKLTIGLVLLGGSIANAVFYLALDYGLYWVLDLIRRHGDLHLQGELPAHLQLHVEGEGVLADVYRAMVTQFDPNSKGSGMYKKFKSLL